MTPNSSEFSLLALKLRAHWPRDRPVLYHGTRYASSILQMDALLAAEFGTETVSLTRRPEVALYWALMQRDDEPDDFGTVLIFDRCALQSRYRLEPFRDICWENEPRAGRLHYNEAEEAVLQDIVGLDRLLIDVVRLDQ